jgi:hypothetical protein
MNRCLAFALFAIWCPLVGAQQPDSTPVQSQPSAPVEKPRVFISDSQSWEMRSSAGGSHGTFGSDSAGGARPQTAEIIKTFGERCPSVIINNKQDLADYIVLLDHEGGKGYLQHKNKVAVFERVSGDAVISHSTLSLGGSVDDACRGIAQHWAQHSNTILAAKQKSATPAVTPTETTPAATSASCSIDSTPAGADIEVDGAFTGSTPSTLAIAPGSHEITIKKKGFLPWIRKMNVTGGNIHLNAELEQAPKQ